MSMGLLSMLRFLMQPTKSRFHTGKSSGRLGTPPSSSGPVKSRDLQTTQRKSNRHGDVTVIYGNYSHLFFRGSMRDAETPDFNVRNLAERWCSIRAGQSNTNPVCLTLANSEQKPTGLSWLKMTKSPFIPIGPKDVRSFTRGYQMGSGHCWLVAFQRQNKCVEDTHTEVRVTVSCLERPEENSLYNVTNMASCLFPDINGIAF
ncbi:hypothetical protein EYF80_019349 [Liparis tanakae]|uniref:Uncharacterized protein n=1 Tax=Liparis tanakae TaxID=230148 RepID=A0A4Z2HZS7_9TELE|nr:hypothetical protein EYF80_019349 [Liparis tanakae]